MSLLVGAVIGLAVNLVTPSVQRALGEFASSFLSRIGRLNEASLRFRLRQLQEEYDLVKKLRENSPELIYRVAASVFSLVLITWLMLVVGYFVFVQASGVVQIPKLWLGTLGGVLGAGSRFFIGALVTWDLVGKVANFEKFEQKNLSVQENTKFVLSKFDRVE